MAAAWWGVELYMRRLRGKLVAVAEQCDDAVA
jgi:hypothetical protein